MADGGLVTTARYLAKAGHEVVVLERNEGAAEETRFQNGALQAVRQATGLPVLDQITIIDDLQSATRKRGCEGTC